MVNQRFRKQVWISVGIIVGSFAIVAGVLYFFSGSISAQAAAIVTDRSAMEDKVNAITNLAQLQAAAPQAAQYQAAINELLPDRYGLVTFTQWLDELGQKYGVTTNAAFQGSVTDPVGTVPGTAQFSFTAAGSPGNIAAFLEGMSTKSSGFLLSLTSFTVTSDGTNENMNGQGTLFFR